MKIVMILNNHLPKGLAANAAAVLGVTLGRLSPRIVGSDVTDASHAVHRGITTKSIPVLGADDALLKQIYKDAQGIETITLIDFNRIAQACRTYEEYTEKLSRIRTDAMDFSGLCLCGPTRAIDALTRDLPLLC